MCSSDLFTGASAVLGEVSMQKTVVPDEAFFDEALESQASIYQDLTRQSITKSADEKSYIVDGEGGYRRVSDLVRKKRDLGNLTSSTAQALGDIFHAIAANTIAEAFPEFNKHFTPISLEGLEKGTLENVKTIVTPIINRAKAEGSVLVVELPIASKKRMLAGTVDLLEITADGKLRMLDYKTTNNTGKTENAKYKKFRGNSDQQQMYKDILKDSTVRKGRNVEFQELMNIKASNTNGIRYQVVDKIPTLYQPSKNQDRKSTRLNSSH